MRHGKRRRRRKRMDKNESMKIHVKRRALERWHMRLTDKDYDALVRQVQRNIEYCSFRETDSKRWYIVDLLGTKVVAVYNPKREAIHTLLPMKFLAQKLTIGEDIGVAVDIMGKDAIVYDPDDRETFRVRLEYDHRQGTFSAETAEDSDTFLIFPIDSIAFWFGYRPGKVYVELKGESHEEYPEFY